MDSCSHQESNETYIESDGSVDDFELKLRYDESFAIACLGLPADDVLDVSASKEQRSDDEVDKERVALLQFTCVACGMHEMVHYFGKEPPFVQGVVYLEDTYVIRDPFQPPPPRLEAKPEYFIALGAPCAMCAQVVCKDFACSFFYTRTYCLQCAATLIKSLPLEAQTKLRKQIAEKKC